MPTHGKQLLNPMTLLAAPISMRHIKHARTHAILHMHSPTKDFQVKPLNIWDEKNRCPLIKKTPNPKQAESGVKMLSCGPWALIKFPVDSVKCQSGCTKADN